jgi:MFS family permease
VLLVCAALAAFLGVVGNNAWQAWMADLVPGRIRGRYFGRRTAVCTAGGAAASFGAGLALGGGADDPTAGARLSALAAVACAMGLVTTLLMRRQHHPRPTRKSEVSLRAALAPLVDPRARAFLSYQLAWNAAIGLSAAFFAVHAIQNLKIGFARVAFYATGIALSRVVFAPFWGGAIDRIGAMRVLVIASLGLAFSPLLWLFATERFLAPIVLEAAVQGAFASGQSLAAFALPLALAPRSGRAFYVAAFSGAGGGAYFAAAIAGGAIVTLLPERTTLLGHSVFGLELLFVLATFARLTATAIGAQDWVRRAAGKVTQASAAS